MSYTNPPSLNNTKSYTTWKKEVILWQRLTDIPRDKQAAALVMALPYEDFENIREIGLTSLMNEGGVDLIFQKLDEHYKNKKFIDIYLAHNDFEKFCRDDKMMFDTFILQFEIKYEYLKKFDVTLSNSALALKLLMQSNIPSEKQNEILNNICELSFEKIKSSLKTYFKPIVSEASTSSTIEENSNTGSYAEDKEHYINSIEDCPDVEELPSNVELTANEIEISEDSVNFQNNPILCLDEDIQVCRENFFIFNSVCY